MRTVVGYLRYDTAGELALLNKIWALQSMLGNHFYPQQKLISKVRDGAKITKKYDKATTPFHRAIDHPTMTVERIVALTRTYSLINPAATQRQIQALTAQLLTITTSKAGPTAKAQVNKRAQVTTNLIRTLAVRRATCCSRDMPFIDHPRGRAYYRHWAAAEPRAAVIFLHGFGEHTGVYHRYGFALNAAGIDLWAVDQFGHGLSPGDRGDFGSIEDSSALADSLTELAERERPGLPLIAQGHSFGSVVTLFRLLDQPERYRAGVISGAPLVPIPEMLDADSSFDLDPGWLSGDPFYLDSLENDPLAFVDADGLPLARELDKAWDRFGFELPKLAVPTLAVHGINDPIAPVDAVRAYAEQLEPLQLKEFPRAHHDILNETVHREVAAAIVDFVEKQAGL